MNGFLESYKEQQGDNKINKIKEIIRHTEQEQNITFSTDKADFMISIGVLIEDQRFAFRAVNWLKSCTGMSQSTDGWILNYEEKTHAQWALNFIGRAVKEHLGVENIHTKFQGKIIDSMRIPDRKRGEIDLNANLKRF